MRTKKATATPLPPPETEIQTWVDHLGGIAQLVGAHGVVLTPLTRKRMARALKGGKDLLPSLQRMAARHGLQIAGLAPADLQPHLDLIASLEPLAAALQSATTLVGDTTLQAKSQMWKGTTALYTILSRMALDNPTLRDELQSATQFFVKAKAGSRSGKSGKSGTKQGKKTTSASSAPAVASEAAPGAAPSAANGAATATATAAVPSSTPTHG